MDKSRNDISGSAMDRTVKTKSWPRYIKLLIAMIIAIIVGSLGVFSIMSSPDARIDRASARISVAKRGIIEDFYVVRASAQPANTHFIEVAQSGSIIEVHVEDGALVKQGQLLATLSNTTLQIEVAQRESDLARQLNDIEDLKLKESRSQLAFNRESLQLQYQIKDTKQDIARRRPLVESGSLSRVVIEKLESELQLKLETQQLVDKSKRDAQLVHAAQLRRLKNIIPRLQSNLDIAKNNFASLKIHAPITGRLIGFELKVGQSVEAGASVGQVDSVEAFKLSGYVDEFYAPSISIGQKGSLVIEGQPYEVSVSKIDAQVLNGQFGVEWGFLSSTPNTLRRGSTYNLRQYTQEPRRALIIDNGPFISDTAGNWAFVMEGPNVAVRRSITLGLRNPKSVEILDGVAEGDGVIVSSYNGISDATKVVIH